MKYKSNRKKESKYFRISINLKLKERHLKLALKCGFMKFPLSLQVSFKKISFWKKNSEFFEGRGFPFFKTSIF